MDTTIVVLITAPSTELARDLARRLLEAGLAACVTIQPAIESLYVWEGELQHDQETLLVVKTTAAVLETLTARVQDMHPYDVPEILALRIVGGSRKYMDWIEETVHQH